MEWRDEGVVIGVRKHGESSAIVEVLTRGHGRHLGMVRGARSRVNAPTLQPGNSVDALWRARLDEHMGAWSLEPTRQRAGVVMASALALHGIGLLGALARLLPEREPHPRLYEFVELVADNLAERDVAPALMVRFELALLEELGFGLDLSACAATGATSDLSFVSPKSGRAIGAAAAEGQPWRDKLLALPNFLSGASADIGAQALADGFRLTGFFLDRHFFGPRGLPMPEARRAFIAEAARPA